MDLKKAIEVLDNHQKWRLGDDEIIQTNVRELTESIELILCEVKKLNKHFVNNNEMSVCRNCGKTYKEHSKASRMCPGKFKHFKAN